MMKITLPIISMRMCVVAVFAVLVFLALPHKTMAAYLYFSSPVATMSVGDTSIIDVKLNTEGARINVVEGVLQLAGLENFLVKQTNTGNSDLSLWTQEPFFSATGQSISFSGGVPKGVLGSDIEVFRIIVQSTQVGSISLQASSAVAYLNDGNGTSIALSAKPFVLASVAGAAPVGQSQDEWQNIIANDVTPPEPFTIELNRDPSVFKDAYFISFATVDAESGIDHYEVTEGTRQAIRSSSPYVLQHQDPKEFIQVTAYDKAGNVRTVSINQPSLYSERNMLFAALILLFAAIVLAGIWYYYRVQRS